MSFSRDIVFDSVIWKLIERFSIQIISFVVTVVLARQLLPEEYGLIAMVTIFINLANVIIDGGLNMALIQKKDPDILDYSTICIFSVLVAFGLYGILYITAPQISSFYDEKQLVSVIRILSLNLIFYALNSIQRAYISKKMYFRKLFYASFFASILSGSIGVYLAYKGAGVWALVVQSLVSQIGVTLILFFSLKTKIYIKFSYRRFISLFDYGWKIFLSNFIIAIYEDVRGLFIGKLYTPSALAFFDRGRQLPSLMLTNINSSIQTVLMPTFADAQDDRNRVKSIMRKSMKLSCYIIFPLLVGLFVCAENIIILLFTDKWISAIPFVRIFCLAFLLMPLQSSNMVAIKALGYSNTTLKVEVIKKIIETIILIISVRISVEAIAWGIVVYNFISLFVNLFPNKKLLNYGIGEQLKDISPNLFISVLMGIAIFGVGYLKLSIFNVLFIQVVLGIVVYLFLSVVFKNDSYLYIVETIKYRYIRCH